MDFYQKLAEAIGILLMEDCLVGEEFDRVFTTVEVEVTLTDGKLLALTGKTKVEPPLWDHAYITW